MSDGDIKQFRLGRTQQASVAENAGLNFARTFTICPRTSNEWFLHGYMSTLSI